MRKLNFLAVLAFSFILLVSCSKQHACGDLATIKNYSGLDCCGWVIKLQDGKIIEPVNLKSFLSAPEDGQKVYITYHLDSLMGCCMVGEIVQLDCLEEQ